MVLAPVAARASPRCAHAGADGRSRRRHRSRAIALLADSAGLALLGPRDTRPGRAPRVRPARRVRGAVRRDRADHRPLSRGGAQLASRARRRVQGQTAIADADLETQREVIDALLAAARKGGFEALLEVLDPDVVLRADRGAISIGASRVVRGATSMARRRSPSPASISRCGRRSSTARPARSPLRDLRPFAIAGFTIRNRTIVEMDVLADSERLSQLDLTSSTDHCHIVARIPTPGPLLRLGSSSAWPRAATACARARSPMRRARGRDGWGGSRCRSGRRR